MAILFFTSLAILFYVYIGYPIIAAVLGRARERRVRKESITPNLTVLIAAYNEEKCIEANIINKLNLDYPNGKMDVIVISDGSIDRTDEIVRMFQGRRIRLIKHETRAGKTSALNMAVPHATGEIIAFADANSIWAKDALRKLVANFADPKIGYVTGKMVYTNPDGSTIGDGCSAYMKYENLLRSAETRLGSVVGVDGGIDAVRKNLYQPMNPDQLPDFVLPLKVVDQGYRIVYEPEAILMEPSLNKASDEYRMRVRVSLRALWALWDMRHLLGFSRCDAPTLSRSALYAWQLWSHKVLRYLCFVFLIIAYFTNLALWDEGAFYRVFFVLQNAGYLSALIFPVLQKSGHSWRALYLPHYFVLLNLASAHAFLKFIMGKKQVMWTPRKG